MMLWCLVLPETILLTFLLFIFIFGWRLYRTQRIVAVVVGFAEDRMMDIITGRAPPPARAESYHSKGSRELARPGSSLVVPTRPRLSGRDERRC